MSDFIKAEQIRQANKNLEENRRKLYEEQKANDAILVKAQDALHEAKKVQNHNANAELRVKLLQEIQKTQDEGKRLNNLSVVARLERMFQESTHENNQTILAIDRSEIVHQARLNEYEAKELGLQQKAIDFEHKVLEVARESLLLIQQKTELMAESLEVQRREVFAGIEHARLDQRERELKLIEGGTLLAKEETKLIAQQTDINIQRQNFESESHYRLAQYEGLMCGLRNRLTVLEVEENDLANQRWEQNLQEVRQRELQMIGAQKAQIEYGLTKLKNEKMKILIEQDELSMGIHEVNDYHKDKYKRMSSTINDQDRKIDRYSSVMGYDELQKRLEKSRKKE
ncbi:MAG: hypothetical protein AB8F78_05170 [Saprospiraceae bacterium]